MALPWDIKLESAPGPRKKCPVKFQSTLQKHYCNVDLHEPPNEEVQTGLMCDIVAKDRDSDIIQRFIGNGMTVARLVLRDMEPDACNQLIHSIRQAVFNFSAEMHFVYPLAILVEIRGPHIVTGNLKLDTTIEILPKTKIKLTTDVSWHTSGTGECLYVGYDNLTTLKCRDVIYIDSVQGPKIKLMVVGVNEDSLDCDVVVGGVIGPKMVVRIAQVPQEIEKPKQDEKNHGDGSQSGSGTGSSEDLLEHVTQQVLWAVASDIDGFLVSNTESVNEITEVRELIQEKGKHMLIFACIDSTTGFENFDAILAEADGIYLDRSVLSVSMPVEKVFLATKIIIAKCNWIGKPCIVRAVLSEALPSLCVTDIANLIIDGVDVIGLELHYGAPLHKYAHSAEALKSAEKSLGAVSVICRLAETTLWKPRIYGNPELMKRSIDDPTRSLCISAVELATRSLAEVIICITNSGRTAKLLSHVRPTCPIIAVTRAFHTARQLRLWRGVRSIHYFEVAKNTYTAEMEARLSSALDYCKIKHILKAGDPYVVMTSTRRGVGYSDSIRLLYASAHSTVIVE